MVRVKSMWFAIYSGYHASYMLFTRKKSRADANTEYKPRTQTEINIGEVCTPSGTVFTQEYNELFVQQVVQYYQDLEGEDLHYHVLGLNESSTEDDLKKPTVNWIFDLTLEKISIHRLLMLFA